MVGPLKGFVKPARSSKYGPTKRQWKGPGYYYHRGHGVWVKWSRKLDKKRGRGVGTGPYRHTTDSRTRALRKKGRRSKRR